MNYCYLRTLNPRIAIMKKISVLVAIILAALAAGCTATAPQHQPMRGVVLDVVDLRTAAGRNLQSSFHGTEKCLNRIDTYAAYGLKNFTSFAVYMDSSYFRSFPQTDHLKEYSQKISSVQ